jgi:hypothetical protein
VIVLSACTERQEGALPASASAKTAARWVFGRKT